MRDVSALLSRATTRCRVEGDDLLQAPERRRTALEWFDTGSRVLRTLEAREAKRNLPRVGEYHGYVPHAVYAILVSSVR